MGQGVGGVVHDDVNAAVVINGGLDQRFDVVKVAHVAGHSEGVAAVCGDFFHHFVAHIGFAAGNHHLGAFGCEAVSDGASDASATARDDGYATFNVKKLVYFFWFHGAVSFCDGWLWGVSNYPSQS